MRFETTQGDTAEPVEATLEGPDGLVSLAGAAVKFFMQPAPESGLTGPLVNADAVVVDGTAVLGDPDFAKVRYWPAAGDVAVPGIYRALFQVTFAGGGRLSFPNNGDYITVVVHPDLS